MISKTANKKHIKSKDSKFSDIFEEKTAYLNEERNVFNQDLEYTNRDNLDFVVLHNLETLQNNIDTISKEFFENYEKFHSKQQKKVILYHDKISFSPDEKTVFLKNPQIALDIAQKWLEIRAPECL